ncbi:PAS domain S-box protein [Haloterrigena sp. H1]|uniref:PAS domain S-box protein n=1 Tax=Haloterrigena sp. H1 TaxID=2552943 RepID=UPI00110EA0CE|nr:PAS domain S-box protein [Haloterrigena sp. H1]TMT81382.1 PAS domain S-box protein [Haloterrigena sp. H1]
MTETTFPIQEAKQQLHQIIRRDAPFDQKAREAIALGSQYLDTNVGYLNRIDQETDYIEAIITVDITDEDPIQDGENDLSKRYCRVAIKDDEPLALHDAPEQGWDDDPAFETGGVHTYLGTPLIIDENLYGTVCFVAENARSEPFSETEVQFAEYITRLLERELDREEVATQLTNQTNLSIVLNRVLRHNLRNDLTVIRGYTELITDQINNNDTAEILLSEIDGLMQLTQKARELEDVISASSDRQHTEVGPFIEELSETIAQDYPNASISVEYDEEIHASVLENFDRAIEELIRNAAKHSGDHPTVTIEIELIPNAVKIRIQDDGSGLPEQEAKVLTEGEETPLTHGSGLGLWLAHWIITSHDGSIDPDVTENGTTMTVSIPRKPTVGFQQQLTELTQSRDKYKTTFDKAKDMMVVLNDEGRIIEANPAMGSIVGQDTQELLGRSMSEFLSNEPDFEAEWREFLQTGNKRDTLTIVDSDGVERILEFSATVDIIPGQHLFLGRDVTEQKQREVAVREAKQRLDLALDGADAGVWDWNMETDEVTWDETMEQLFGLETDTYEGTLNAFFERVHPDDRKRLDIAIQTAIEEDERFEAEYRIQRNNGGQRWVNARGELFSNGGADQMVGIVTDITERKEREYELESLKERYETLLDAAPDPVFIGDTETGEIIEVNAAAEKLVGEPREDIIGRHQSDLHPSDQSEQYRQLFEEQVEEGKMKGQLPDGSQIYIVTGDGEQIPVEISVDTVSLRDESVIFGIFRDISERLEREAELESKTRAIDKAPVGIALSDPNKEDNPLTYVNEQFSELTGYNKEEILGKNCRFLQEDGADPETVSTIRQAIEEQEPVTEIIRNYRKDGTKFWNQLTIAPITTGSGELANYVAFQDDVTDQIEREQALEETTQRLEAIFEASPDAIVGLDKDATVELWNDAAEDMFGYTADTVIGESIQSVGLHSDEQYSELRERFKRALEGETLTNHEIQLRTKDGERSHLRISTAPIKNKSGEITGVMGIAKRIVGNMSSTSADRDY